MFAPGADKVVGHFVAFVHISARLAHPACLSVAGRRCHRRGFRLDVLVVVFVCKGRVAIQQHRFSYLGNKQRVCP